MSHPAERLLELALELQAFAERVEVDAGSVTIDAEHLAGVVRKWARPNSGRTSKIIASIG
jgi:hypothetical protein